MVPKTIMALFIQEIIKESDNQLMKEILRESNQKNLIEADSNKLAKVKQLEKELENLKYTMNALDRL